MTTTEQEEWEIDIPMETEITSSPAQAPATEPVKVPVTK